MLNKKTAILLVGFGGPTSMAEVQPFLNSVLAGAKIPQARLDEVMRHYELFQGRSPYNEVTKKQRQALEIWFKEQMEPLPVFIGYRHSLPDFKEVFEAMRREGVEKVIAFILSSFRCYASYGKYLEKVEEGRAAAGASQIKIECTDNFYDHPFFHEAQADQISKIIKKISPDEIEKTYFLFSAHSVPVEMSRRGDPAGRPYSDQFSAAATGVAERLGLKHWGIGYQSRSGNPKDPWLEPSVVDVIVGAHGRAPVLDGQKFKNIVLIPIGFLCDNIEVLYDLDVEAKAAAEAQGIHYLRASTVADHPKFIEMMGTQILNVRKHILVKN